MLRFVWLVGAVTLLNLGSVLACGSSMVLMSAQQDTGPKAALENTAGKFAVSQPFDIEIHFCGAQSSTVQEVRVAAVMPAHQHGMNYVPVVTSIGDATFLAKGMLFHMPGVWRIDVSAMGLETPLFYELEVTAQ